MPKQVQDTPPNSKIELRAHPSYSYVPRTGENAAGADVTVAFAVDFTTAGERLTARLANERLVAIPYGSDCMLAAKKLGSFIEQRGAKTLNVAGNGIYTLAKKGVTQAQANRWVYDILREVVRQFPLSLIRSGGQFGIDQACLVAGIALGIPVLGLYPKGFRRRNAQEVDHGSSQATLLAELQAQACELVREGSCSSAEDAFPDGTLPQTHEMAAAAASLEEIPIQPGINIASGVKGLGGGLTNMSELARRKGNIKHSYPVELNGTVYPDSEAAYQALKYPGQDAYNDGLMIDIICAKLLQNPKLKNGITRNGGVPWLSRCSHQTGAKSASFQSWEGLGLESRFIRNLIHGYTKALTGRGPVTRVVHVRDAPFDVYIGRANGSLPESPWHNPSRIGEDGTREEVVASFDAYLQEQPALLGALSSLQGKTLGCWCKSRKEPGTLCHGDVLAARASGLDWVAPVPPQASLF